jgi:NitT/TauT family transport system permease protein
MTLDRTFSSEPRLRLPRLFRSAPRKPTPNGPRSARKLPKEHRWGILGIATAQIILLTLIIGGWEVATRTGLMQVFFWSQPSMILDTLWLYITEGDALLDTATTAFSTLLGFVIGTSLGSMIGLSFWWSRNYAATLQPFIICFESMPKLALAPLIVLMFGMGLVSKVAIAMALTIVVSALTTYSGVRAVDPDNEKLLYSLGASRMQVFRKLVIPSTLPWIISVLRVNIGLALTGSIVGEFISSQHGLGRAILYAGQTYEIALVWTGVLILSCLSMLMYIAVSKLESILRKGVVR